MHKEFSKFIVVGIISTIVNYCVFYILLRFAGVHYTLSSAAGYISGVFVGYLLNRNWTFGVDQQVHHPAKEVVLYALVYTISLLISLGVLWILVDTIGLDARLSNIIVIGISTVTNFVGLKLVVFKSHVR